LFLPFGVFSSLHSTGAWLKVVPINFQMTMSERYSLIRFNFMYAFFKQARFYIAANIYILNKLQDTNIFIILIIYSIYALKDAGISTLFDRRAQLSSHLFEDIVNKPDHKLSGLLPPQAH
jgi:hypothetical protein